MKAPKGMKLHPFVEEAVHNTNIMLLKIDHRTRRRAEILANLVRVSKDIIHKETFREQFIRCGAIPFAIETLKIAPNLPSYTIKTKERETEEKYVGKIEEKAAELLYFLIKKGLGQANLRQSRYLSDFSVKFQELEDGSRAKNRMLVILKKIEKVDASLVGIRNSIGTLNTKALLAGGSALALAMQHIEDALLEKSTDNPDEGNVIIVAALNSLVSVSNPENTYQLTKAPTKLTEREGRTVALVEETVHQYECILTESQSRLVYKMLELTDEGVLTSLTKLIANLALSPKNKKFLSCLGPINKLRALMNHRNPRISLHATQALLILKNSKKKTRQNRNKKIAPSLTKIAQQLAENKQQQERENYTSFIRKIVFLCSKTKKPDIQYKALKQLELLLTDEFTSDCLHEANPTAALMRLFLSQTENKEVRIYASRLLCELAHQSSHHGAISSNLDGLLEIARSPTPHPSEAAMAILSSLTNTKHPNQRKTLLRSNLFNVTLESLESDNAELRLHALEAIHNTLSWSENKNIFDSPKLIRMLSGIVDRKLSSSEYTLAIKLLETLSAPKAANENFNMSARAQAPTLR